MVELTARATDWGDDYFADGDDERRHFEDWHDDEEKKASTVGYLMRTPLRGRPRTRCRCYFARDGLLVTGVAGLLRRRARARGDRCIVRKGNEKADLAQAWWEMAERQDKKKADVPITPDVTL